jgi:rubrerythrin
MNVREALEIAIDYEHKVRDHYVKGSSQILDPRGKKVFETLAREEQRHVEYLESRLDEWHRTGKVTNEPLSSVLPSAEWIENAKHRFEEGHDPSIAVQAELDLLKVALELEHKASGFYLELVTTLPEPDRPLFARFLDIEQGHVAIVQAEINSVSGLGTWFDFMEFSLEAG